MNQQLTPIAKVFPPRRPDMEMKVRFSGQYRLVLNENNPDRETVDTGWFDNLVTDNGLNLVGNTDSQLFSYASIGTGTAAPANSDTSLAAFTASTFARTQDSQNNGGASTYVAQCQFHYVYAQGAVVGNMAEVGIGKASNGTNLFSRARIVDGAGTPTTLTVVALDQLTTYYKLTCTPVLTDLTSSVTISAVSYNYTARLAFAATFAQNLDNLLAQGSFGLWGRMSGSGGTPCKAYPAASVLGAITAEPSGTGVNCGSASTITYTNGNFFTDCTLTLSPSDGNLSGGIGCLLLNYSNSAMQFQYQFTSTVLPKDNTKTLTLVVRFSWSR